MIKSTLEDVNDTFTLIVHHFGGHLRSKDGGSACWIDATSTTYDGVTGFDVAPGGSLFVYGAKGALAKVLSPGYWIRADVVGEALP